MDLVLYMVGASIRNIPNIILGIGVFAVFITPFIDGMRPISVPVKATISAIGGSAGGVIGHHMLDEAIADIGHGMVLAIGCYAVAWVLALAYYKIRSAIAKG